MVSGLESFEWENSTYNVLNVILLLVKPHKWKMVIPKSKEIHRCELYGARIWLFQYIFRQFIIHFRVT